MEGKEEINMKQGKPLKLTDQQVELTRESINPSPKAPVKLVGQDLLNAIGQELLENLRRNSLLEGVEQNQPN